MMKLSPMIGKMIKLDEWMGATGFEEKNPEWQKIIDESGLSDKLQELSELQMEGADVFHSTFEPEIAPLLPGDEQLAPPVRPETQLPESLFGDRVAWQLHDRHHVRVVPYL